jgi:hypothetical protein
MGSGLKSHHIHVYCTATQLSRILFMSTYRSSHRSTVKILQNPQCLVIQDKNMLHHVNSN